MDVALKVTKDSMMVLKAERTMNLYKMNGSVVVGDVFVATDKRALQDFGTCVLDT